MIRIEGLGKQYRIGKRSVPYRTLRESLASTLQAGPALGKRREEARTFWALRDVNLVVEAGETVGIIGRNGAGKSTLLKLLARITEPTEGWAELHGRVASLLEVGTGFHMELTGRENIYFNGTLMGMTRGEIARKFDEIVAFAEVERFIDTPVKHYSSGMNLRLGFAVAAHLEPEILIVDEVLAVGDAQFQKKCLSKLDEVARGGRTVLFVSHNLQAVRSLCARSCWLDQGTLVADGASAGVIARYLQTATETTQEQVWHERQSAPGTDEVRLHRASVRPLSAAAHDLITTSTPLALEFEFWNLKPGAALHLGVALVNDEGVVLFRSGSGEDTTWQGRPYPAGLFRSTCVLPGDLLNDGVHRVQLQVVRDRYVTLFQLDNVLVFEVQDPSAKRDGWRARATGAVRPRLKWQTELVEGSVEAGEVMEAERV